MLESTRKYKNSIFIVYDTSKANYGLSPLRAYRFTEKAFESISKSKAGYMPQKQVNLDDLSVLDDLFEEVPIKVQRSHMQQAYLFDFIQPEMPAFNTNILKLSQPDYLSAHVHQAAIHSNQVAHYDSLKQENLMKAF